VSEEELLDVLRRFDRDGVMRRYAAVLRHRRAGFRGNGMGCWIVPEERIVEAGEAAAAFRAVSHCYQRPAFPPRWPYNLFTMVHGQGRAEVEEIVERIRKVVDPEAYTILYSVKEFKKQRVRYFEEGKR
jgi:DNA-binding Lrp family transcriptional regulator